MKHLLFVTLLSTCAMSPATAQTQCGKQSIVSSMLADKYQEQVRSIGVLGDGSLMSIYANVTTGTWTITRQMGDVMCIVADGDGYEEVNRDLPPNL